ncbi:alpha/beta fold hydrolase [Gordonia sp. TBRC 11910]|uniref:Alpha/beta fold hydrolase n=1 Tax=Gordonia asplenii TaxID=2725283 RepID=A0A848KX59_9ACTN|nr:alpha/beta fold hydrolase [Gordonia asplenii]NMO00048.1 alpha/beta fold hydrolase [Gordonia asplenii]
MSETASDDGAVDKLRREIGRNLLRARNGIKLVAGLSNPRVGLSPRDLILRDGRTRLYRYRSDQRAYRPAILLVYSLVTKPYILDLRPGNSFIEKLIQSGFDVYLLDWGTPDERDSHLGLEYHVDHALPEAVDAVRRTSGDDQVNLVGYCFGGDLALMYAARERRAVLRSLTVVACPVDLTELGVLTTVFNSTDDLADVLDDDGNVPADVIFAAFRAIAPTSEVTGYVNLVQQLWSDDYVEAHQAMMGWASGHVAFPGAAARQMRRILDENALVDGTLVIGGTPVDFSQITVPFLAVLGASDHIVPASAAAPVMDLVGSTDKELHTLPGGHAGLFVGRTAAQQTLPTLIEFFRTRSEATP